MGCGWLGLPLSKHLIVEGYAVKGSTTQFSKLNELENEGIEGFYIELKEGEIFGEIDEFLSSDILVINIPPRLKSKTKSDYLISLKSFLPFLKRSTIQNVLFISSTAIYPDTPSFQNVNEETRLVKSEKGEILKKAEGLFYKSSKWRTTVLRFGGLIGKSRHPAKYLAGKKDLANPESPVNLISLDDCVNMISLVISKNDFGEIYNGCYPEHPSREEYYTQICERMGLDRPTFSHSQPSIGKIVNSEKIQNRLGFSFNHPIY